MIGRIQQEDYRYLTQEHSSCYQNWVFLLKGNYVDFSYDEIELEYFQIKGWT
jgi:hypothetical protein